MGGFVHTTAPRGKTRGYYKSLQIMTLFYRGGGKGKGRKYVGLIQEQPLQKGSNFDDFHLIETAQYDLKYQTLADIGPYYTCFDSSLT